jgi:predicted esterase YcpF (UPF0227 family)
VILYLHGFLSSPHSSKAGRIKSTLARAGREGDFLCPQLPVSPRAAAEVLLATAALEDPAQLVVIGSSLGGYYATWIAERLRCRAVLLNPAIRPYEHLSSRVGWHTDYAGQRVEVRPEYMDELQALETGAPREPQHYLLVAATGDELIDYRDMLEKYQDCRTRLIEGSDHALSDFEQYLPEILEFCGIPAVQG